LRKTQTNRETGRGAFWLILAREKEMAKALLSDKKESLQLGVFGLRFFQNGNLGIGILP
jgi:hypothetical protein